MPSAAATTSLPEWPGSGRNWDYRFCWMRDTFYTLNAFNNIGHFEELEQYFHYILNTTLEEENRYQPLYGVTGKKALIAKTRIPFSTDSKRFNMTFYDILGMFLTIFGAF